MAQPAQVKKQGQLFRLLLQGGLRSRTGGSWQGNKKTTTTTQPAQVTTEAGCQTETIIIADQQEI